MRQVMLLHVRGGIFWRNGECMIPLDNFLLCTNACINMVYEHAKMLN